METKKNGGGTREFERMHQEIQQAQKHRPFFWHQLALRSREL